METLIIGPMDPWGPFATGFIGLIFAFILYGLIMKFPAGKQSVVKIGDQIHLGAKVFMITEYKILAPVVLALVLACGLSPLGWYTALAIAVGALSSAIAGFIGMYSATKANVRTATAAENHGQEQALSISFFGGSIMGLCVASMGLVGLGGLFFYFSGVMDDLDKIANKGDMIYFDQLSDEIQLTSISENGSYLVLAGKPLQEPVARLSLIHI